MSSLDLGGKPVRECKKYNFADNTFKSIPALDFFATEFNEFALAFSANTHDDILSGPLTATLGRHAAILALELGGQLDASPQPLQAILDMQGALTLLAALSSECPDNLPQGFKQPPFQLTGATTVFVEAGGKLTVTTNVSRYSNDAFLCQLSSISFVQIPSKLQKQASGAILGPKGFLLLDTTVNEKGLEVSLPDDINGQNYIYVIDTKNEHRDSNNVLTAPVVILVS